MENKKVIKDKMLVNLVRLDVTLTEEQYKAMENLFDENNWEMDVNSKRHYVEDMNRFTDLSKLMKEEGLCEKCGTTNDGKTKVG